MTMRRMHYSPPRCATLRRARSLSAPQPPMTSVTCRLSSFSFLSPCRARRALVSSFSSFRLRATEGLRERGSSVGASVLRRVCRAAPKLEGSVALRLRLSVFFDLSCFICAISSSVSGSSASELPPAAELPLSPSEIAEWSSPESEPSTAGESFRRLRAGAGATLDMTGESRKTGGPASHTQTLSSSP
jgi:hypothetical protein